MVLTHVDLIEKLLLYNRESSSSTLLIVSHGPCEGLDCYEIDMYIIQAPDPLPRKALPILRLLSPLPLVSPRRPREPARRQAFDP